MTEKEWFAGTHPDDLLEFLRGRGSDRKLRLFMCACCRRFLPLMPKKPAHDLQVCEKYVAMGEKFADGSITWAKIEAYNTQNDYGNLSHEGYLAWMAAHQAMYKEVAGSTRPMLRGRNRIAHPASAAAEYSRTVIGRLQATNPHAKGATPTTKKRLATIAEKRYQIQLLHDIFGNPFGPVLVDPVWLTDTVVTLAESIYSKLAFDRLPILADALEDAGCENKEILAHCRSDGPHVKGCWAVDALTDRK